MINQAQVGTEWWKDIVKKYSPPTPSITCRGPKTRHRSAQENKRAVAGIFKTMKECLTLSIYFGAFETWSDEIQDKSIESLTQFCMLIRSGPAPPKETLQVDYRVKKLLHICIYRVRIFNIYILVLYQLLAKIYFFFFCFSLFLNIFL